MSQMKEQNKITAGDLNEMKINNMPVREFKVMAIKLLIGLDKRVGNLSETLNKEVRVKKNQSVMQNSITDIKNTLEGINSRL